MAALDKERPNIPAKAPPKPKGAGRAPPARLAAAQSEEDLLDEEPAAAAPAGKAVRGGKAQRAASKTRVTNETCGALHSTQTDFCCG